MKTPALTAGSIRVAAIAALVVIMILCIVGWFNRADLLLAYVKSTSAVDTAPTRPVPWQQGPSRKESSQKASSPLEASQQAPTTSADGTAGAPPNIIFILADDLGINDITRFGGGVAGGAVRTPAIDQLAAGGVSFTQAYAGNATCAPSRAMLLTGRYPTRHGFEFTPTPGGMGRALGVMADTRDSVLPPIEFNATTARDVPAYNDQGLPGAELTIAEVLKARGYHTVHIGKWHLGLGKEFGPNAQGFDESLLMANGLHQRAESDEVVNAPLDFDPIDRFLWARMAFAASYNEGELFEPGGYLTDYWTDEAIKVIDANQHRPFFLYLAHWAVHTPLQATRADYEAVGDLQPERLRVYAAMVRALDRSVARIMAHLDTRGLTENTLVVFASDNGGTATVGLPQINAPYRGWKLTFFEGGIRTPLFMHWPQRLQSGRTVNTPVAHIDLMPTLVAAADAELPDDRVIDGINLLPAATGQGDVNRPGEALYWQSGYYQAVRKGDWKLQVNGRQNRRWLYNLAVDPTEQEEVSAREPAITAELTALLEAHQLDRTPPRYPHTTEGPVPIDKTSADIVTAEDDYVYWPN